MRSAEYQASILRPPLEKMGQMRQHRAAHQREHRVRLVEGARDGELRSCGVERSREPRYQVGRQERRIAGHGRDQRVACIRESDLPGRRGPAKPPIVSAITRWPNAAYSAVCWLALIRMS
jgi:hypothetical protein